ncbi:MAG: Regulatory protein LuxO [Alphaproteobacteria bacterium MarineAlpha3_Bin6]|nr:MAG: Regulatory protein LuxO [Alphaproteobacteria bacterium MarineAlpha3_Bin6]
MNLSENQITDKNSLPRMAHDILIIDDEADIRMLIAGILEDEGYQTHQANDSSSATKSIETRLPSVVLLDIWLEGSQLDGMELLAQFQEKQPHTPVIMISGHGNIETAVSAINLGACDFIEKPFTSDRLLMVVNRVLETELLKRENQELRLKTIGFDKLVGSSSTIGQLRQAINKVAPTNSRILITGPGGSGKDLVASLIHAESNRSNGPFISINCATMQPENFEIGLFGHETSPNGSPREVGTLEQAHMGTLFLDEVADMPLETQGKIVRVLQEQTFQRVGGATRIHVDVRVIAASSKDLTEAKKDGQFREDLYYRLSVVPLKIPALKHYREDIPELVKYFIDQIATSSNRNSMECSEQSIATLQSYDWPGNVRELRNVIERILIMAPNNGSTEISVDMIPAEISSATSPSSKENNQFQIMGLPLREAREIFEREYLISQVSRFGGNISRTAIFIEMERSALHRKLKALGVQAKNGMQAEND